MENQPGKQDKPQEEQFPGYPSSSPGEDIYNNETPVPLNPQGESRDMELDVPGSELDDKNEMIGEEDEENNYYSIGGDNHNDLEESKGE